ELLLKLAHKAIVAPSALPRMLAEITVAAANAAGKPAPAALTGIEPSSVAKNIAASLAGGERRAVLLVTFAEWHHRAATLHAPADFVVALSAFKSGSMEHAHVLLPVSPFTETAGTFINCEGRAQAFNGVVMPLGQTRPAWKVLRVLGSLLSLPDFGYESIDAVRAEVP